MDNFFKKLIRKIRYIKVRFDDRKTIYYRRKIWPFWELEKHRDGGPAVIFDSGTVIWYKNDEVHREDGPAIVWKDGSCEWWLNGESYNFNEWIRQTPISDGKKMLIVLLYFSERKINKI